MSGIAQQRAEGNDWFLEIPGEAYNTLVGLLRVAASAAGQAKGMLPHHLADPLERSIQGALTTIGDIMTPKPKETEPEVFDLGSLDEAIKEAAR